MKRTVNISAVLMLIVYGALTLVAAPLHRHSSEDVSKQHAAAHASHDCGVCTYASASVTSEPPQEGAPIVRWTGETVPAETRTIHCESSVRDYPRRGPPALLS
ncbi:MAG: hypothetical protein HUU02_02810 [Bacteroidetes bacterium]|nr:hypothetical protein [Bacteroidota bacterium]